MFKKYTKEVHQFKPELPTCSQVLLFALLAVAFAEDTEIIPEQAAIETIPETAVIENQVFKAFLGTWLQQGT